MGAQISSVNLFVTMVAYGLLVNVRRLTDTFLVFVNIVARDYIVGSIRLTTN